MTVETKANLSEKSIQNLQDLIQINIDSINGLKDAAEGVNDDRVENLFRDVLAERASFALELQVYVEWNKERAIVSQSLAGRVHQLWMDVRSKLNGGDPYVILIEAERGEDSIKAAYEHALSDNPASAVGDVLHQQLTIVKSGHDRIRDMRDLYAKK
ncbi:MAG: PA2169 family four-helix-bundle protein [Fuerstiella sp.]